MLVAPYGKVLRIVQEKNPVGRKYLFLEGRRGMEIVTTRRVSDELSAYAHLL